MDLSSMPAMSLRGQDGRRERGHERPGSPSSRMSNWEVRLLFPQFERDG